MNPPKNPTTKPSAGAANSHPSSHPSSRRNAVRISLVIVVVVLAVMGAALLGSRLSTPGGQGEAAQVVRADSHQLSTAPEGAPVLVEFLDFECESCKAAHPFVEQLRRDYAGRVTFVIRYFPLPGHANSTPSALAAEAAAQQGQLEAMYQRLYETQEAWGEQPEATPEVFRAHAEAIGLDMAAYDAAVADPATAARVAADFDDGVALGVTGTPTFFLDGERLEVATTEEFRARIDAALAGRGPVR